MKNFIERTLTGSAFIALIIGGIMWHRLSFIVLTAAIYCLCLMEFYKLINILKNTAINILVHVVFGALLFYAAICVADGVFFSNRLIIAPLLLYVVGVLVAELYEKRHEPLIHAAYIFFGHFYITLPLALFFYIAFENGEYNRVLPLALFVFIWVYDTFAYLTGITLGRHRLFERISPKKSWEGVVGGFVFTLGAAWIFSLFSDEFSTVHWIGMAATIVVFSTFGDLFESLIKRTLNVKDSGDSLPGHGGFLDRFDSLLFAVYGMFIYCLFV
jgi:phosphatidate cytidylyltransferase